MPGAYTEGEASGKVGTLVENDHSWLAHSAFIYVANIYFQFISLKHNSNTHQRAFGSDVVG